MNGVALESALLQPQVGAPKSAASEKRLSGLLSSPRFAGGCIFQRSALIQVRSAGFSPCRPRIRARAGTPKKE